MKKNIYLYYAANTPVDLEILKTFNETTIKYFANPNSTHDWSIRLSLTYLKEQGYEVDVLNITINGKVDI